MKINKEAFSLVIAILIVLVSSLLAYTIIEYMLPFSRNVSGIENATKAYYNANKGIEKGLYFFSTRKNEKIGTDLSPYNPFKEPYNYDSLRSGFKYKTTSKSNLLPIKSLGDSDYDNNWNKISVGNPIQLSVGYNFVNINNLDVIFRTPKINGKNYILNSGNGYISWQLVGPGGSLNPQDGNIIKGSDINYSGQIAVKDFMGKTYTSTGVLVKNIKFGDFFQDNRLVNGLDKYGNTTSVNGINCDDGLNKCLLKFSLVKKLKVDGPSEVILPYLEWQIRDGDRNIPLRYSILESSGKSNGFGRTLIVRYPQDTVNQAFDFAVFQ